jgi:hypothetical protein
MTAAATSTYDISRLSITHHQTKRSARGRASGRTPVIAADEAQRANAAPAGHKFTPLPAGGYRFRVEQKTAAFRIPVRFV